MGPNASKMRMLRRRSLHLLHRHAFMCIHSVKLWRPQIQAPMVGFQCWDVMLMEVFGHWFVSLPFSLLHAHHLYFIESKGWRVLWALSLNRICQSSHLPKNWLRRICMAMNGVLGISFGVISMNTMIHVFCIIECIQLKSPYYPVLPVSSLKW